MDFCGSRKIATRLYSNSISRRSRRLFWFSLNWPLQILLIFRSRFRFYIISLVCGLLTRILRLLLSSILVECLVVVAYLQTSWAIPPRRTHIAKSTDLCYVIIPKRVGNWVVIRNAKARGIVWRYRTSKMAKHKMMLHNYDCGCLCSQVHNNLTVAAFLFVLARIQSLQMIPSAIDSNPAPRSFW